jgi:hypothetical protein
MLGLLKKNSRLGFVLLDKQPTEAKLLINDMDHVAETRAVSDMAPQDADQFIYFSWFISS